MYKRIIDELIEWEKVPSITLSYEGESTLNPKICEYLRYLDHKNIRPWISTRELSGDENVLSCLLEYCGAISVSIDGDEAQPRGNNKTDLSYENLKKRLIRLIDLSQKSCFGTAISVSRVLHPPENIESPLVKDFVTDWIDHVHEIYLWQKIDFSHGLRYSYREGIEKHLKRRRVCEQPFSYVAVLSDGRISPCCNTSRTVFTTINADDGLEPALASKEYQNFLEKHRSIHLQDMPCHDCELWLDSWIGDEILNMTLKDGLQHQVFLEGSSYRIKGKS